MKAIETPLTDLSQLPVPIFAPRGFKTKADREQADVVMRILGMRRVIELPAMKGVIRGAAARRIRKALDQRKAG
jgi:hypothetical protein